MNEWKTFTWEELSVLASMQMSMHVRFRDRPPQAGSRKSRRFHEEVRKEVEAEWPKFSLSARQALLRSVQNGTLPDFLEQCGNELDACLDERDKQAGQLLAGWPAPEKHALLTFLSYRQWPESIVQDGVLVLSLEDEPTFSRTLSLLGVQGAPTGAEGRFFQFTALRKEGDTYLLVGEWETPEEEGDTVCPPLRFSFTKAAVQCKAYRADALPLTEDPWLFLYQIALSIVDRQAIPGCPVQPDETALLPLLKAIIAWEDEEAEEKEAALLARWARESGCETLAKRMERLVFPMNRGRWKKEKDVLRHWQHEPLWRWVMHAVWQSQVSHPVYPRGGEAEREKGRLMIQEQLHREGYTGCYPNFVKVNPPQSGLRLAQSYGDVCFIGLWREKRMVSRILCREEPMEEPLRVQYLCTTALPRKGEPDLPDGYACLFREKGRRFCMLLTEMDDTPEKTRMACAHAAAKKAELRRVTRRERKAAGQTPVAGWIDFAGVFLGVGFLFTVFMLAFTLLFTTLLVLVTGQITQWGEAIGVIPWGWLTLLSWVGFGGGMAFVTLRARNR